MLSTNPAGWTNAALGTYRDREFTRSCGRDVRILVEPAESASGVPANSILNNYLLGYPSAKSTNIESEFYWEKVNFGLKPTLRIVQAIVYRGTVATDPAYAIAIKQLYSSHYFEAALDLTVCLTYSGKPYWPGSF